METTILVGNACILTNKNLGNKINEYDNVVRFNQFKLDGYVEDLGSKTTTIFYNHTTFISPSINLDKSKSLILYNSRFKPCGIHVFNKLKKFNIHIKNLTLLNLYDKQITKIHKDLNYPKNKLFSTGFVAIVYYLFILKFSSITITNFDFQSDPNNIEYFNHTAIKANIHCWSTEEKYANLWVSMGLIKFLY